MFSLLKTLRVLLGDLLSNRRCWAAWQLYSHSCQGVAACRCAAAACRFIKERCAVVGAARRLEAVTVRSNLSGSDWRDHRSFPSCLLML